MLKRPLILKENAQIVLTLESPVEHDVFNNIQTDLHTHLRTELNNGDIKVSVEIQEHQKGDMLYTNREKYEFMAKENPHLKELTKRLGLDPDLS